MLGPPFFSKGGEDGLFQRLLHYRESVERDDHALAVSGRGTGQTRGHTYGREQQSQYSTRSLHPQNEKGCEARNFGNLFENSLPGARPSSLSPARLAVGL